MDGALWPLDSEAPNEFGERVTCWKPHDPLSPVSKALAPSTAGPDDTAISEGN